ncbi:antibiotic biosynthesis monooxygenase [Streptomyces sp. NPDC050560]|uniref:antibiotic biosynthesis monooxygenase n=1 Tax=Streptomyces sp. NPDC050560 TaxID=3365630 RepID=UPI003796358B
MRTLRTDTLPDLSGSHGGPAFFSTWRVGSPERQRRVAEAVAEAWEKREWPHPGLLSYAVFANTDGDHLMHQSLWRDQRAHQEFVRLASNGRDERNAEVDRAAPGIERIGLARTRHYRGGTFRDGVFTPRTGPQPTPDSGIAVLVKIVFEGPDEERQRAWTDALIQALATEPEPMTGARSADFHLGLDGATVFNYSVWDSEQAHRDRLAAHGEGIGSPTPAWERTRDFPGHLVESDRLTRNRLAVRLVPEEPDGR